VGNTLTVPRELKLYKNEHFEKKSRGLDYRRQRKQAYGVFLNQTTTNPPRMDNEPS
jgi:hypothetical protein